MFKSIDSIATLLTQNQPDKIAKKCKFIQRNSSQLSALSFVLTLLKSLCSGDTSFSAMASCHAKLQQTSISRQAMHKRINRSAVTFLSRLIKKIIQSQPNNTSLHLVNKRFNRVLLEDCTVLKVHKDNKKIFRGNGNGKHETAGGKIHHLIDWTNAKTLISSLHHARDADQSLNEKICQHLKPRDLVLRDMGFFKLTTLKGITDAGAFWISRLPTSIVGIESKTAKPLNEILKSTKLKQLDLEITLGTKSKLRCRVIARRLPEAIVAANIRKRKADAKRRGATPNKESYLRDRWAILCTNIKNDVSPHKLQALYQIRWNIEIQFRGIKQSLEIEKSTRRKLNKYHLKCLLLGIIIYQLLTFVMINKIIQNISIKEYTMLSYEKLCKELSYYFNSLTIKTFKTPIKIYVRHIYQEKRNRKTAYCKALMALS